MNYFKKFFIGLLIVLNFCLLLNPVPAKNVNSNDALMLLTQGNERFVQNKLIIHEVKPEILKELAKAQHPFAVIITCSDSRVPPELIFDQGLGSLFVIRTAGNVIDPIVLGSVEYAVEHLHTKLVVVMGHTKCGAVKATVDGGEFPENIQKIIEIIEPSVEKARLLSYSQNLYEVTEDQNIFNMVNVLKNDPVLSEMPDVVIKAAKYNLETGTVNFKN